MRKPNEKLRRVLVLGGNTAQVPYIEELKARGFWVALTDLNDNAPGRRYADAYRQLGYEDIPKLIEFAHELDFSSEDNIFTASAQFAHFGAASVAERLAIPYPPVSVIKTCLDKTLFYPEFQRHSVPIPETKIIKTAGELEAWLKGIDPHVNYYLKSDFSKNPKYIYRFIGGHCCPSSYFWGTDRYLRNAYVLQKEFEGRHLRLNLMPGRAVFYDFSTNAPLRKSERDGLLRDYDIVDKLGSFLKSNQLQSWLVKFDIIVREGNWCALDIGLDPPYRMRNTLCMKGHNFASYYLDQYIKGEINYPEIYS